MTLSKLVIAAFALSATAAMAHGNKQTSAQTSSSQASSGTAMQQDESSVKQAQQALNDKGFNVGTPDGIAGPKTQAAVKKFQQQQNIGASGQLDPQTLAALGIQTSADMTLGQDTSSQSNTSSSTASSPDTSSTSSSPSASTSSSPSASSSTSASAQSESPSDTSSSSSYTTK